MNLQIAELTANKIVHFLERYCARIQVAGSIRRKKQEVHDIDIVLIPRDPWELNKAIKSLGTLEKCGPKMTQIKTHTGAQIDFYFATEETWATLLLIRTGSADHNIKLCSAAKARGWKLCASGNGLFDETGDRIAGDTETSIFRALGMAYVEPERRD